MNERWEYKSVFDCTIAQADSLGNLGWELVAIVPHGQDPVHNPERWIFKRQPVLGSKRVEHYMDDRCVDDEAPEEIRE